MEERAKMGTEIFIYSGIAVFYFLLGAFFGFYLLPKMISQKDGDTQ